MTHLRILALALVLSGCEESSAPPKSAPKPVESTPASAHPEVEEAPVVPQSSPQEKKPAESAVAAPAAPPSPAMAKVVRGSTEPAQRRPAEEEAELKPLDMSLPAELLEAIEPGEPLRLEPVLPSLFGHEIKRDYRLDGRLIEGSDGEHLVEGAELRLEIRR